MTHLQVDHTGGLPEFPDAQVHVHRLEFETAMYPQGLLRWVEYVRAHWAHGPRWAIHFEATWSWFGFEAMRVLSDELYEVLLIPLPGHTPGRCGVALRTYDRWLFVLGDAAPPFYNPEWEERYRPPRRLLRPVGVVRHLVRLQRLWREQGDRVQFMEPALE